VGQSKYVANTVDDSCSAAAMRAVATITGATCLIFIATMVMTLQTLWSLLSINSRSDVAELLR